ncbi:helicase [Candidatus Kaiserbacteria bacterium RIFOXYD1_FULL_47_14]|uniref:Helicase n=1 Tax=Candidatus Kaiserbacteria bacterium RIFOXYD1_FULL_47_14 TaxID=1798533 RepID=A0A1F6G4X7_9BACT|nr:MAG: helicase [Candidatus Kaiserbacteria bacterium RIFOXYD1_FULL_47_14]
MSKIDDDILKIDKVICANIGKFDDSERGLLSQNILSQLRNFVEHISLKAYSNGREIEITYDNITLANVYVSSRGNLKFLTKFHNFLQITTSHYTLDEENSERLMLKYYEYLLKIRSFLKKTYKLDVLENINEFPIKIDPALKEYYEKIAGKIILPESARSQSTYDDRYYIQKIKPFFVEYEVYYEVTFTTANDGASKFDRIIAFTKLDISPNYAVKLTVSNDEIEVLGKTMPIQIIDDWDISIRPCELNHYADIFGKHTKQGRTIEYRELMSLLKRTGLNLVEVIDFSDDYYQKIKKVITQKAETTHILDVLDKSRELIKNGAPGSNVLRYLLYRLNNKIIKQQYWFEACERLSNLNLKYGCIPFDQMPFTTSLINHNPRLSDLFDCIDSTNREYELFARHIKNNTEIRGQLYTPQKDIVGFQNIDALMQSYNAKLYIKHGHRKLENYKDHLYINGYEEDTFHIIEKLKELSSTGIKNYSSSVDSWLQSSAYQIDSDEKRAKLRQMFEDSEVALIYGSAGTGKSTLINHVSNFFNDRSKLYLTNTNPAIDNLKRRVSAANSTFKTIAKFLSDRNNDTEFDLLIIDECSTVGNSDMLKVLKKASFKLLVLVGDVFQIESIRFGNWFSMARDFVPATSVSELTKPYRSHNPKLLDLWDKVRNIAENILEHITKNDYSITLNESIFDHSEEDEIILCLNYDGLYGINNINRFLQRNNKSVPKQWGVQTYKVNDPILFNESERFAPLIYNNLKGKIVGIELFDDKIQFDIELDRTINQLDAEGYDFELMDNSENDNSVIRFFVNKLKSTDEDDDSSSNAVVPFQIAYAVSIHKAQGLEYNSVKVVITDEIEEMITHNIFYTAITRTKEKLKIYWTPETESKVLSSLKKRDIGKDVALLSSKFNP